MVRRRRLRRWMFLGLAGAAAIACGLDITGTPAAPAGDASSPSAEASLPDVDAPIDATVIDVYVDAEACDAGGGFCNFCDPSLALCIRFDGGAVDESRYHHRIDIDGSPAFIQANGLGAIALDGSTFLSADVRDVAFYPEITLEMLARVGRLPHPDASRFGLFDRAGIGPSMYLYGGEGEGPHLRCMNEDVDASALPPGFVHFACTVIDAERAMRLYVNGRQIGSSDAAQLVPPSDAARPLFLGRDDPSGDDFIGDIATIRIFTRAKRPLQIAAAAGLDADTGP